jgi:hypothetical protein
MAKRRSYSRATSLTTAAPVHRADSEAAGAEAAAPRRHRTAAGAPVHHPAWPDLPASAPLTYTLTMQACLSPQPEERPDFVAVLTLLADVCAEVNTGTYVDSNGRDKVRWSVFMSVLELSPVFRSTACFH